MEQEIKQWLDMADMDYGVAAHAKLQHSYEQSLAGEGVPYNEVFDEGE